MQSSTCGVKDVPIVYRPLTCMLGPTVPGGRLSSCPVYNNCNGLMHAAKVSRVGAAVCIYSCRESHCSSCITFIIRSRTVLPGVGMQFWIGCYGCFGRGSFFLASAGPQAQLVLYTFACWPVWCGARLSAAAASCRASQAQQMLFGCCSRGTCRCQWTDSDSTLSSLYQPGAVSQQSLCDVHQLW